MRFTSNTAHNFHAQAVSFMRLSEDIAGGEIGYSEERMAKVPPKLKRDTQFAMTVFVIFDEYDTESMLGIYAMASERETHA